MRNFLLILVLLGCGIWQPAYAQERTVTGLVTDATTNEPLPGVTVKVQGTTTGTVTNLDGQYSVSVSSPATLVFSFVGYNSQVVQVGNRSTIDVQLVENIEELSEVVVVGYGTQEKRDATGAVTTISSKEFNNGVISTPEQLIQGKSAGVQVTSASGEPGSGMDIRIRGTSSLRSGTSPLYVLDGIPLSGNAASSAGTDVGFGSASARNPLTFLNPNDIDNISILKDASATAIYGSRGANGVVLITTKTGKKGAGELSYSSSVSVSKIANTYDLLDRESFLDAYENLGLDRNAADLGADTDWQDEIFRTAISHDHNLAFGGGSEEGSYRLSFSYFDQEGIVLESGLERMTGRVNANRSFLNDRLNISTQLTFSRVDDENVPITNNSGYRGDLLGAMIIANPTRPVLNPDGTFNQPGIEQLNPVAMLGLSEDNTTTLRTLAGFSAQYEFFEGLSFMTSFGYDQSTSNRSAAYSPLLVASGIQRQFSDDGTIDVLGGRGGFLDIRENNILTENYFTYDRDFGGNSNLEFLLGYSYQRFAYETQTILTRSYRTTDLDVMINNAASASQFLVNTSNIVDELQSYYGRANLNLADKYLITATVRADGSTKFGENNKYGIFPSLAFAWRLSDENFIPDAVTDLKLRVGVGLTGNQDIPNNQVYHRQRYSDWSFAENGDIQGGNLGDVAFANPDLRWESTTQYNFGLDYGFINNRLTGSLDLYYKTTNDQLVQVVAAQPAPQEFYWKNLDAEVINQGVELSLHYVALDTDQFSWSLSGNAGYNKTTVENYSGLVNTGQITGQGLTGAYSQRIANEQPLFVYYLRNFDRFDDEGLSVYPDGDVQQYTGKSPLPKVTAGLTNNFRFGNFDLNFFFNGLFGHYIYNNTANAFFTAGSLSIARNVNTEVVTSGESSINNPDVSTRFLEKGDFVRLQNATFGYNLPTGNINSLSSLRFFVTGQNLLLFTNYSGLDPEVNTSKGLDGFPSAGIDYTSYPRARAFTFGFNVTF